MKMDDMVKELKEIIAGSDNIVFFGGAGVSTESGIPDFRSENGLYHAKQEYGFPPETILSHTFYKEHPDVFFKYYKENLVCGPDIKPNAAHEALARLEEAGKLKAVITQNIDGLHQAAGSKAVYELHGTTHKNHCEKCGKFFDLDYVMDPKNCGGAAGAGSAGDAGSDGGSDAAAGAADFVPYCDECGGRIKPDVVLYEEALDNDCMVGAVNAIMHADVLIVGGTSLNVYPAAGLITYFKGEHLVLINKSETPYDRNADLVIHGPIGEVLGSVVE